MIDPCSSSRKIGTIELKCPEGKKNHTSQEAMEDELVHIELADGKPNLKKDNHLGYYTQVQLVMGFCGLQWVDFVVHLFKGMIITRVPIDKDYFDQVVCNAKHPLRQVVSPSAHGLNLVQCIVVQLSKGRITKSSNLSGALVHLTGSGRE